MKRPRERHVSRKGLGDSFIKKETQKSNLILEANLLKAQARHQDAADRFAQAAAIEDELCQALLHKGLRDKYFVHRFSALSCWAQAGDVYHAIVLGDELLARADLPDPLRAHIEEYVQLLQTRRVRWFAEFAPAAVAAAIAD